MATGLSIQVELKKRRLTQRWLLGELRKRGFPAISEGNLSLILNGKYRYRYGDAVIKTAEMILKEARKVAM